MGGVMVSAERGHAIFDPAGEPLFSAQPEEEVMLTLGSIEGVASRIDTMVSPYPRALGSPRSAFARACSGVIVRPSAQAAAKACSPSCMRAEAMVNSCMA
jgi:hypothetical protein